MKRVSKVLFIAVASFAMAGTAAADDPKEGEEGGDGGGEAGAEAGGEATAGGEAAPSDAEVTEGAVSKENWPLAAIDRPLSAAKGMIELTPQLDVGTVSVGDSSETIVGAELGGRYGISDKLELLFAYRGITFSPESEFKGDLTVGAGFLAVGGPGKKMDLEPKVAFQYDLLGETAVIAAGIDVRTKLTPKLFIGTPINRPGLVVTVKGVDVGMDTTISPMFLDLPFAIGFQATPKLMIQANTLLGHIALNDDAKLATGDTAFVGADFITLDLDVIFAMSNKMDVRVGLNFGELKESAGDLITAALGVNFRL